MSSSDSVPNAGGGLAADISQRTAVHISSPAILQHVEALSLAGLTGPSSAYTDLLSHLCSPDGNIRAPLSNNLTYSLPNYYISSSHNTYLTGNQLSSHSSAEGYRNVLLRGCRSVEIDVWNGERDDETAAKQHEHHSLAERLGMKKSSSGQDDHEEHRSLKDRLHLGGHSEKSRPSETLNSATGPEAVRDAVLARHPEPRVLHGHTLTKEIPFRLVCETIRDSAFVNSDLPVIVSLEIHTSLQQQQVMVDIMKEVWHDYLIPDTGLPAPATLPSPADLRRKILIKVKYTAPETAKRQKVEQQDDLQASRTRSNSDSAEEDQNTQKPKKRKMLDSLSALGIYTRAYTFKGFDRPEARIPEHVFSLSENTLLEANADLASEVLEHNKHFMMRAYPKAIRITSNNLNPVLLWRQGVQMAALNWQDCDKGIMLNEAMFSGTPGYVLKPHRYRPGSEQGQQSSNSGSGFMDIQLEVFAGQQLTLPPGKLNERDFEPYIRCSLHVETPGAKSKSKPTHETTQQPKLKAHTTSGRGRNPSFGSRPGHGAKLSFKDVYVDEQELCFLRLKVVDDVTLGKDALAAWACIRLDRVRTGLRIVKLWDAKGKGDGGLLLVKVSKVMKDDREAGAGSPLSPNSGFRRDIESALDRIAHT